MTAPLPTGVSMEDPAVTKACREADGADGNDTGTGIRFQMKLFSI
jgi:hypothetical protein